MPEVFSTSTNSSPIEFDSDVQIKTVRLDNSIVTSTAGAVVFDYGIASAFIITLDEDVTGITIPNPPVTGVAVEIIINFVQDAMGGWEVTGWPASVLWPGDTAPTITVGVGAVDLIRLFTNDGGTSWLGTFDQNFL